MTSQPDAATFKAQLDALDLAGFPLPDAVVSVSLTFYVVTDEHGRQCLALSGELPSHRPRRHNLLRHALLAIHAYLAED